MVGPLRAPWHSRGPVELGGRRVGVRVAGELHVRALQVPVAIEALDGHLGLICGARDELEQEPSGEEGGWARQEDSGRAQGEVGAHVYTCVYTRICTRACI